MHILSGSDPFEGHLHVLFEIIDILLLKVELFDQLNILSFKDEILFGEVLTAHLLEQLLGIEMFEGDLVETTLHQIHLDNHGFKLQVSLLYGLFQECHLALLILGTIKHLINNCVFLLYDFPQLVILALDALFLGPLTKNLIFEPFDLSSKFSNLLCVVHLLLRCNIFLQFIDFLEASLHLILIIFGVAFSDVFHLVLKSWILRWNFQCLSIVSWRLFNLFDLIFDELYHSPLKLFFLLLDLRALGESFVFGFFLSLQFEVVNHGEAFSVSRGDTLGEIKLFIIKPESIWVWCQVCLVGQSEFLEVVGKLTFATCQIEATAIVGVQAHLCKLLCNIAPKKMILLVHIITKGRLRVHLVGASKVIGS